MGVFRPGREGHTITTRTSHAHIALGLPHTTTHPAYRIPIPVGVVIKPELSTSFEPRREVGVTVGPWGEGK